MAKCGKKCEVFSRVVGYHRPVDSWNKGKKEEFEQRKEYNYDVSMNSKHILYPTPISSSEGQTILK